MGNQPESATSKRKLTAREREARSVELRKEGHTYQEIADELRYKSPSGARDAILRAMEKMLPVEEAEEVRKMEAMRLDAITQRLWGKFKEKGKVNLGIVDRLLRIMERRARLLGIDAPVKSEVTIDMTVEEVDDAINREVGRLAAAGQAPSTSEAKGQE